MRISGIFLLELTMAHGRIEKHKGTDNRRMERRESGDQ